MKTKSLVLLSCISCISWFLPCSSSFAADPLTEALQKGLLEEEVNRNLPAAAQAYEAAVKHADAQRRAAATAIFRLAETYRRLGRTNEATAQYERLLLDFADQTNLVVLARHNLVRPGFRFEVEPSQAETQVGALTRELAAQMAELARLTALEAQLKALPRTNLSHAISTALPDVQLTGLLEVQSREEQQLAALQIQYAEGHPEVQQQRARLDQLEQQISRRSDAVLVGLQTRIEALKASTQSLQAGLSQPAASAGFALTPATERQKHLLQQELALVEEQLSHKRSQVEAGVAPRDELIALQREVLALQRQIVEVESRVRPDLLDISLPTPTPTEPTTTASLREEIKLLETLVADLGARSADRGSRAEVDKARRELLELQRQLPENADLARQRALLDQAIALARRQVTNLTLLVEAGRASKTDEVQAQRELLALERDLAGLPQIASAGTQAAYVGQPTPDPADVASLKEEIALVEQELETNRRKHQNGKAEATEVRRSQKELIHLQRQLPENASPDRQTALLKEELKLSEENLEEVRRRIQVGTAAPLDEIPYRREMLAIQRELRAVERASSAPTVPASIPTVSLISPGGRSEVALHPDEPPMTLAQLVAKYGGDDGVVDRSAVRLFRVNATTGQREIREVNVEAALRDGGAGDLVLQAGDQVEVLSRSVTARRRAATQEEAAEIERIEAIIKNSPDLVNARNATASGGTPLHKAAENGYVAAAEFLLANRADADARDGQGRTPLYLAASAGHKRLCELLLEQGATVGAPDDRAYTPLHRAAIGGYLAVAETLIAAGAEVNTKGYVPALDRQPREGQPNWAEMETTPLHSAAEKGFPALVELLVKHGADLNPRDRGGRTPLIRAVLANQPATVRLLLEQGADVNAEDGEEQTALAYAVVNQNLPMMQLLLEHRADTEVRVASGNNDYGWTVLFEPVGKGKLDATRLLLDRGANINAEGTTGLRPVHWAVIQNARATLNLLLERKAEVNLRDTGGNTPLHYALEYAVPPNVEALLEAGADPKALGWNGGEETSWPPLLAVVRSDPDRSPAAVVELLLKHGADVNARLTNGWTALHRAAEANRSDLAELLVSKGADVNARGELPKSGPALGERRAKGAIVPGVTAAPRRAVPVGVAAPVMMVGGFGPPGNRTEYGLGTLKPTGEVTPLHLAVANQHLALARSLLDHGADVNARAGDGQTPLHYAVNRRDLDLVRLLLDAKADPNASDAEGQTPLARVSRVSNPNADTWYGVTSPDRGNFTTTSRSVIAALLRERGATEPSAAKPAPAGAEAGVGPAAPPKMGVARVLGEVKRPGTVQLGIPRKDIIDAIAECGGFTDQARPQLEFTRGGVTQKFTLDELKAQADPANKLWLEPGDLIEVKPKVF